MSRSSGGLTLSLRLPQYLASAIDDVIAKDHGRTAVPSAALTRRYKTGDFAAPAIRDSSERNAYLATRLPATFAAATRVFLELRRLAPQAQIASLLDLGAGPGTALFAAAEVFPELGSSTLIEADPDWVKLGKKLAAQSASAAVREAQWLQGDLHTASDLPAHDAVVISYALGELTASARNRLAVKAWQAASQFMVLIEPGTTRGFANIRDARSATIAAGAQILAPCPHKDACPMVETGDWCHFAQRLERTSEHRRAKRGSLGYEDEKFSYLIASRESLQPAAARIVRHPRKHSGHVQLELCTPAGMVRKTVTKSQRDDYREARRAEWGDQWSREPKS